MTDIIFFVGTTTELIKLSPIIRELEKRKLNFKVITSGQTNVNFGELAFFIKKRNADLALRKKMDKSSMPLFLLWSIRTLVTTPFLKKEFNKLKIKNGFFIVHGDPVSSLLGAIIAKYYGFKLVHIESGLRSFSYREPFPEEICRLIISKFADIHFCPNEWAIGNLSKEKGEKVNTFQNTMIEGYLASVKKKVDIASIVGKKKYFVFIIHRQEHVVFGKDQSKKIIETVLKYSDKKLLCIFITHATTVNFLKSVNFKLTPEQEKRVKFVSRLHYIDFVNLIDNSEFLVTDGGSNQEEAYYMGLPCLLLRNKTERIEGLGENVVLSKNNPLVIKKFMQNYKSYRRSKIDLKIKPSKIIVDYLLK